MAFTLEDGTGVVGSNAYVSVAFVTAYLTDRARETENLWSTLAAASSEAAIIAATDYVERLHRGHWKGVLGSSTQGLSWPRTRAVSLDGLYFDSESLPVVLMQAVAELAVRAVSATLQPDLTVSDASGVAVKRKMDKIGPLETEIEYVEGGGATMLVRSYPAADALLAELIVNTQRTIRA